MSPDRVTDRIEDMYFYARRAEALAKRMTLEQYLTDWQAQMAMERALEIIGEAASKVSTQIRDEHPEIPWDRIIGHRIVMAHKYADIEHQRVWHTATEYVPPLIAALRPMLPPHAIEESL